MRPDAPRFGARGPVTLRSTHASWVFLAGAEVWKIKRPVELGFLDFRTLEARRRFCEEEVRLNRRLAPDVYLGVDAIHRSSRGLSVAGEGPVVEWAVHMRRLPDEASASARLANGRLTPDDLAAVAERVASFHREARPTPAAGDAAALRLNVEENFSQVEPFVGDLVDRGTFDDVRTFQRAWLAEHGEAQRARVAEGRIREGHGDLRLEHVYFLEGPAGSARPTIIDCIEFNERFRCGDVANDAAFLAMELDAEKRPDLAAGFLARFAEASQDFGMYGVLDFYLSYRAWVRGKVAAFVAADPTAAHETREAKRREARRDFALARSYVGRPLDGPFVLAVGGTIGAGKSTLAESLGRELAIPVVSSDRTRKMMEGLPLLERGAPALYTDAKRDAVYVEILRRASVVLGAGRGLVLDATFQARRWRAAAAKLARDFHAPLVFIEATCADRAILRARLAARRGGPSISDATDEQLDELERRYEPPEAAETMTLVGVDTSGPAATAAALAALRRHGILPARERCCS